jgi:hypothetical protein
MRRLILYVFLVSLAFAGCGSIINMGQPRPDILIRADFDGDGLAVVSFTAQGSFLQHDAGILAADRFSEEMFLRGRYNVIDRARVNNAILDIGLAGMDRLSDEQIQELGRRLDAKYIAVGKVYQETGPLYHVNDIEKKLTVSIRIIDTGSTDMVGVIRHTIRYKNDFHAAVSRMAIRIAGAL